MRSLWIGKSPGLAAHRQSPNGWIAYLAVTLALFSAQNVWAENNATDLMHKARSLQSEDSLLSVFGTTLQSIKEGDWETVRSTIKKIDPQIKDHAKRFDKDLKPMITEAVASKDPNSTLRHLAHTIFLGMKFQFSVIIKTQIDDYLDSKARLDLAHRYYSVILSGNVRRKDSKIHRGIEEQFTLAEAALGNPGIDILLPEFPPDLESFQKAIKNIEIELLRVYTFIS